MSDTPETQEAIERWRQGKINIFDEMARLERERDKERKVSEKRKTLLIYFMETLGEVEDERDKAMEDANYAEKESSRMRAALQRLADCDWVITLPDRMDAVRKIARDALKDANLTTKSE